MQTVERAIALGLVKVSEMQRKAAEYAAKKVKGIDGFVVAIIIIVIAIAIGALFKEQISVFINNFFQKFATQTQDLF